MRCSEMARPPVKKRLRNARRKRSAAARQLALLESGAQTLELILRDPGSCGHVRLWAVMNRAPRLGEAGVRKCLTRAKVYPMTRLDNLTEDEIDRVIACLPPRARP